MSASSVCPRCGDAAKCSASYCPLALSETANRKLNYMGKGKTIADVNLHSSYDKARSSSAQGASSEDIPAAIACGALSRVTNTRKGEHFSDTLKSHLWKMYQEGQISADHTAREVFYQMLDSLAESIPAERDGVAPSSTSQPPTTIPLDEDTELVKSEMGPWKLRSFGKFNRCLNEFEAGFVDAAIQATLARSARTGGQSDGKS